MPNYQLSIQDFSLSYKQKLLLDTQTVTIQSGLRIGIIGRNGTGKSTLLRFLYKESVKQFKYHAQYVPQLLEQNEQLSGGEHLIKRIYCSLIQEPEILFLDEPTNHLDEKNRSIIFKELRQYSGTLIFVSHDIDMLNQFCDEIWQLENQKINKHKGNYHSFCYEHGLFQTEKDRIQSTLKKQAKENHASLMREQIRASKSKQKGIKSIKSNKYATIKSPAKVDRGNKTSNIRKLSLREDRKEVAYKREQLHSTKKVVPSFHFSWQRSSGPVIHINAGSIGYETLILKNINLAINAGDKVWLQGDNGSGKSTFIKALRDANNVQREGEWHITKENEVGYVDQFYSNLNNEITVFDTIKKIKLDWTDHEIRTHLNHYLFRTNDDVEVMVVNLSEGEKARLSFAIIGCQTPKILILDEITNNLDIETKRHVIDILKAYPGTLVIVCHEKGLAETIKVDRVLMIYKGSITEEEI